MTQAVRMPADRPPAPVLTLVERVPGDGLDARERQMLTLMAEGLSTREVARRMCYSERTIKNVLQDLNVRLQFRNRTHAVVCAVRRGWI